MKAKGLEKVIRNIERDYFVKEDLLQILNLNKSSKVYSFFPSFRAPVGAGRKGVTKENLVYFLIKCIEGKHDNEKLIEVVDSAIKYGLRTLKELTEETGRGIGHITYLFDRMVNEDRLLYLNLKRGHSKRRIIRLPQYEFDNMIEELEKKDASKREKCRKIFGKLVYFLTPEFKEELLKNLGIAIDMHIREGNVKIKSYNNCGRGITEDELKRINAIRAPYTYKKKYGLKTMEDLMHARGQVHPPYEFLERCVERGKVHVIRLAPEDDFRDYITNYGNIVFDISLGPRPSYLIPPNTFKGLSTIMYRQNKGYVPVNEIERNIQEGIRSHKSKH